MSSKQETLQALRCAICGAKIICMSMSVVIVVLL
jgi:hypothetical protein